MSRRRRRRRGPGRTNESPETRNPFQVRFVTGNFVRVMRSGLVPEGYLPIGMIRSASAGDGIEIVVPTAPGRTLAPVAQVRITDADALTKMSIGDFRSETSGTADARRAVS